MLSSGRILCLALGVAAIVCGATSDARSQAPAPALRGDVSAASFDAYCAGALSADRRSRFSTELDRAEAALDARDLRTAESAFGRAFEAAHRGGAESNVSIKCLGEPTARRWFEARLEFDRLRVDDAPSKRQNDPPALRVLAAAGDSDALVAFVERKEPRAFVSCVGILEAGVDRLEAERRYGGFLLSEEETLVHTSREAIEILRRRAATAHGESMARERLVFDREATDEERAAARLNATGEEIFEALAGTEIEAPLDEASLLLNFRARESIELLRVARMWNLEKSEDERKLPSSKRARVRGDELLKRARDTQTGPEARDALLNTAQDYFELGGFDEAAAAVAEERAALAPALRAERERRERALEAAASKLDFDDEAIRRSAQDMMKSEAEKKAFDDEADALEDELGF